MPDFTFTFTIKGITAAQAQNIQNRLNNRLAQDGVTASGAQIGQLTRPYRVRGVDTSTGQVFDQTVDAADAVAAQQQVGGGQSSMVVVTTDPI